jgi:hypothetical protein
MGHEKGQERDEVQMGSVLPREGPVQTKTIGVAYTWVRNSPG